MKQITYEEFVNLRAGTGVFAFGAPWCKDCQIAAPMLATLASKYPQIGVYSCNIDGADEVRQALDIRHIPTIFFIKNGEIIGDSLVEPKQFAELEERAKALL